MFQFATAALDSLKFLQPLSFRRASAARQEESAVRLLPPRIPQHPIPRRESMPEDTNQSLREHLLELLRIAQWDILEFSRNKKHESPKWPEGYWPKSAEPSSPDAWKKSVAQFESDLKEMQDLVKNPKTDLFAKIPWGDGQTILREALLVADHNAYHIAQLVDARRLLGAW